MTPDDADRTEEVIVTVPLRADAKVASLVRPPRPVTYGRRRSDRYLSFSIIALLWLFMGFTIYVAWQLAEIRQLLGR